MIDKPEKFAITSWALEDRPREKLMMKGAQALSSAELIAILIGSGNTRESAVVLAQRILNSVDNSLMALSGKSIDELVKSFSGIGEAKAITIMAALEIGRRRKEEALPRRRTVKCAQEVHDLLYEKLVDLPHEEVWLILLNTQNRVLDTLRVAQGGVSQTGIDMKLIFKAALERLATRIILCHNHPSGSYLPSESDNLLTQKVKTGAAMLDILLMDHVIFTEKKYFSYAEEHLI